MEKRFNISQIFYAIALCAACFAVSLYNSQNPLIGIYARGDTSVYQYIGKMMWQGIMPYRDIFDHKGPVIYLWNMAGIGIHAMWGQWLLEFLLLIGSASLAFIMAGKYLSPLLSFLITTTVILFTPHQDTIGNTESLSVFLNFVFLYGCLLLPSHIKPSSFLLGTILALQLFIKPTHAMMGIIFNIGILLKLWKQKNYPQLKIYLLYNILGFLFLSGLLLLWLWMQGILADFYDAYLLFNLQYTSYWKQSISLTYIINFYLAATPIKLLLGLTIVLLLLCLKQKTPFKSMILLNTLATTALILLIIMPFNPLMHYAYMLSPILFIDLVLFCLCLKKYPLTILVLLVFFLILSIKQTTRNIIYDVLDQQNDTITDTARFLQKNLPENEPFAVLGYDMCRLYLLSELPPATHYPMNSMVNRIMPLKLFTELKNTKPQILLLRREEVSHYTDNFNTYWPEFSAQYQILEKNSEYYIFKRIVP